MRDVARGTFEDWRSPRRPREGGCDRSGLEKAYVLMAETFRAHLAVAGVDRAELFEKSESRRPIRIHDLRATFITVNLANGKTEAWIADRTGHTTSTMINRYRRAVADRLVARPGDEPERSRASASPADEAGDASTPRRSRGDAVPAAA